ncbi:low molecular weight phosphotyrosine protein phosphatase [Aestuariicella sp. G3-2]|uniref:low molecular weight protein-tyrosine-phosphatase n=1 Tax=Pseudomaricurvus albidus TaxID=2842452 RepID=UPI001C0DDF50|nr:low molecular weight protein-tyrosine-phosphatase [Aestuariicella albida]MBU3070852.1 low molecular weight phosphotyrosine protein phosphatase [Aestuariicella albida]
MPKIAVLFVCHANVCRSPMAEGILKEKIKSLKLEKVIKVDSAGTQASLISRRPDKRAQKVSLRHGIDISRQKSRRLKAKDLKSDYILVMDREQLNYVKESHPEVFDRTRLLLSFCNTSELEVPDPYYGSAAGFDHVYEMLESAVDALLENISSRLHQHS